MVAKMESSIALVRSSVHSPAMKGAQVRAAREMLGLSQIELAEAAGISRPTLRDIENETGDPRRSSMEKVGAFLESCGIRFVDEVGAIGLPPQGGK